MAISMVREPSETPNITNVDDFVGLRYAYGNRNGYVRDFGSSCSYSINGNIFHINSGRLVLQGVECDINANGVDITIDSVSTTRYYVVYLEVNLSANQVSIKTTHSTSSYPIVETGDDLTSDSAGTANLPMYKFSATNGTISNVVKVVEEIKYINENEELEFTAGMDIKAHIGTYTPLRLQSGSTDMSLTGYKDVNGNYLGYIGCDADKDPVFYNTETSSAEKLVKINTTETVLKEKVIYSGTTIITESSYPYTLNLSETLSEGDKIKIIFGSSSSEPIESFFIVRRASDSDRWNNLETMSVMPATSSGASSIVQWFRGVIYGLYNGSNSIRVQYFRKCGISIPFGNAQSVISSGNPSVEGLVIFGISKILN